jgi:Mn2+/Fe2+ NRAMP family transporter
LGPGLKIAILLMMCNAAVLGTTAISLSSAWAYGEVKSWPHSLEVSLRDAPGFYGVYIGCTALAAAIVLIPRAPLQLIILSVQVLAGIMLPSAIIFLQLRCSTIGNCSASASRTGGGTTGSTGPSSWSCFRSR